VVHAFLNFGESSLFALGAPPGKVGWEVAVRDLDPERALGTLTLRDQAVSVSAVFGHQHRVGAKQVGHIVDPRSGLPLTRDGLAVVVARSAAAAEAFSKALLIDERAVSRRHLTGALVVRATHLSRIGHIAFTPFAHTRSIPVAAEALQ
jgi:thiamine biosynthesis lipoprotein